MQISKNKVVFIDYTLKDDDGNVIDSSQGREPLPFIQGVGNIIPGLENALEGKAVGDSLQVSIPPAEAYGERNDEMVHAVPRKMFETADDLEVGMQFQTQSEAGMQVVTVVGIEEEDVMVDANHPLAGATLNFDVAVMDIRDASEEELEHGHVHGPGGHDHGED